MTGPLRTFVINLDRDKDRLAHMLAETAKAGLAFERMPAVYLNDVPAEIAPYLLAADVQPHGPLLPAEIGCYASHLAVLHRIVHEPIAGPVLVFEDDVRLAPDFAALLDTALQKLPPGWDILRLSNPPKRAFIPAADLGNGHELVRYSKIPNSSAAYLISPAGAAKFLQKTPRLRAVDEDLRRPWHFSGLETYGLLPLIAVPNTLASTINSIQQRPKGSAGLSRWLRRPTETLAGGGARLAYNLKTLGLAGWCRCAVRNASLHIRRRRVAPNDSTAPYRISPGAKA